MRRRSIVAAAMILQGARPLQLQGARWPRSYDADLTWNDSEKGPSLFTTIQEQLGPKLDAQRGAVDVLVTDSAERPTED
jgi:uncharacterized protein (TIGR03435 family)